MKSPYRGANFFGPARLISLSVLVFAASCSGATTSATTPSPQVLSAAASRTALSFSQAATKAPLLPPAGTIYFGAWVNYLKTIGPFEQQTAQFEAAIGRKLAIHAEYYNWADAFPDAQVYDDFKNKRVPVISWECGATDYAVANGAQDALITARAQAFKAYGHRVFLRFMWEMNLPYAYEKRSQCIDPARDVNGLFNAADYVAAWNHIHAIFVAQGAKNVVWLWCPSGNITVDPMPYYPGPTETDWIGFDHYDVTGNAGFVNTMSTPYSALLPLGKPMIVGETGSAPNGQAAFYNAAPSALQTNFPGILGLIYYDAYGHRQDWRLTSAGIAAAATAGATPYFSAFAPIK